MIDEYTFGSTLEFQNLYMNFELNLIGINQVI